MDRNYIIGLVLIFGVFMAWMFFSGPMMQQRSTEPAGDSLVTGHEEPAEIPDTAVEESYEPASIDTAEFAQDTLPEQLVLVETDLYTAVLSTRGGALTSFKLKKYTYANGEPIEMIHSQGVSVPNFRFNRGDIRLRDHTFSADESEIRLSGADSENLTFSYEFPGGATVSKTYRFTGDQYGFDLELEVDGVSALGLRDYYEFYFAPGLEPTEEDIKKDLGSFKAHAMLGSDIEEFKKFNNGILREDLDGVTDWIATRSKYFIVALIPDSRDASGLLVDGTRKKRDEKRGERGFTHIGVGLKMRLGQRDNLYDAYTVYMGPLDYNILSDYGNDLENTLDLGISVLRPLSKLITWLLIQIHKVIPNYGVVVLLFAVVMKLLFSPLSYISMKSMKRMQAIQPLINDLREKYKSDPQKMNQKMMELWKEHKVNPAAGCLPMLPQLPVFFALFTVFRYTIEFRNAPFAFWMTDLALPDPYYVLPILMSGTMFLQQKLTVKDPKQKMMIYIFPALFLWWGISFPSGLCLYWTATNLFSLVESVLVHKRHLPTPTIQPEPAKSDAGKPKKHNKKKRQ